MPIATEELNDKAYGRCDEFGLHPKNNPMGDDHHTDAPMSEDDKALGDSLAWFLGSMYCDVGERYFYHERTSVDEWGRVARALRIHGLKIVNVQ